MTFASVIIPVWNGISDLPACLAALATQSHSPREIIAVDNASTDASGDWIAANYPDVRLIRNAENVGFGEACNIGLVAATGDVLVLLNQDTIVRADWLSALVQVIEGDATIGIAGSKALYPDGTIQHAGASMDARGASAHIGYRQADNGQFDRLMDCDFVTGASLAIRRTTYAQVGGFDPGFYPAYLEDVDLCYRVRAAGWRVVYAPTSVLIHNERSTAATVDYDGALLHHRHRLRFVYKHWSLERLQTEFMPAESAWLMQIAPSAEQSLAIAHHAYLVQLLNLGNIASWRQRILGEDAKMMAEVAKTLVTLRNTYPLHLIGLGEDRALQLSAPLQEAHALIDIREQPFQSNTPIIGPLIAAFRQKWNSISTQWYVRPMIRQQSAFNSHLWQAFTESRQQQHDQQARTGMAMMEYIGGHTQEINELSREIERLKQRMAELEDQK